MPRNFLGVAAALLVSAGTLTSFDAIAADAQVPRQDRGRIVASNPNCQDLWRCSRLGCKWHRVCSRPCPDGYSCYPLYGAYGPYGGVAYWGGYTDSGWGPHR